MFRSLADSIDLVITELHMPVMDGIQTILRIRMTKSKAKVVCMTAYPPDSLPKGVILLVKPFSNKELVSCVDQTLLSAVPVR